MINKNIEWAKDIERKIIDKLEVTVDQIGASCPHASINGKYDNEKITWWTNGFWPGILWNAYRASGNEKFKDVAVECEKNLDEVLRGYIHTDHDAGFMWSLSAVANYKLTQNEESRIRGLIAANYMAGRFHLRGNFIGAWNVKGREGWAIMDCLMNLPILYWASEQLGDRRFKDIAMAHTDTVLREFIRDDGSVNHIVAFDLDTGEVDEIPQGQGYSPTSAWARGTSWAVYGLALGYKYTGEIKYLNAAKKVAHFFISNLPENFVPRWDFRAPITETTPPDTSAAAVTACGLLEIAGFVDESEKELYYNNAVKMLKAITEEYACFDASRHEILGGGTGHVPQNQNINVGLIYGDYFYVEAISRLCRNDELFW